MKKCAILAILFLTISSASLFAREEARLLRDSRNPVVILGRGDVNVALKVRTHRVSASAKAEIEKAGGSVETIS